LSISYAITGVVGLKLFRTDASQSGVSEVMPRLAEVEADVQGLVEAHMETLLGVRFLASEYGTGPVHKGRIDSLGLDENGSPVIVEYKRGVDAGVINQGLFYLAWLMDHRAEIEHLVRDRLGMRAASQVLWSSPRLICIAGDFTRYDVHAVHTSTGVRSTWFATDSSGATCSGLRPWRPGAAACRWHAEPAAGWLPGRQPTSRTRRWLSWRARSTRRCSGSGTV
jgi:hypothetical protein